MVYVRTSDGTVKKAKKKVDITNIQYNDALESAAPAMQAAVSVFEPVSAFLTISGGAVAYVAFNKLFMINHYRL